MPTKEQVKALADFYREQKSEIIIAWLSDKVVYEVQDEDLALKALKVAEEKVSYRLNPPTGKPGIISTISTILKNDGRVAAAWLFGSMARKEDRSDSDVDIIVELNKKKRYSMFDLVDIACTIEKEINRKVDLVEKGYLKDFALHTASNDLVKIYG